MTAPLDKPLSNTALTWRQRVTLEANIVLVAIQFLTRLPVPHLAQFQPWWLDKSAAYFPLTGMIVGGLMALMFVAASAALPGLLPAVLTIAFGILLTGAFHEDGLADTADGLGGGLTPERRLEIMKDSRIGTYGTAALLMALLAKVAALDTMAAGYGASVLIAAHTMARFIPVVASAVMPYAGGAGAKVQPMRVTRARLWFAALTAALPLAWLPFPQSVVAFLIAATLAILVLYAAFRLIGGQTGDCLGAAEQVAEVAILVTFAA